MKYDLTKSAPSSDKETFHAEFDLSESDITYTSGDALGIYPLNNPPEVQAVISALHSTEHAQIPIPKFCFSPRPEGEKMALGKALTTYYDLKTVKLDLVKLLVSSAGSVEQKQEGKKLLKDGVRAT